MAANSRKGKPMHFFVYINFMPKKAPDYVGEIFSQAERKKFLHVTAIRN